MSQDFVCGPERIGRDGNVRRGGLEAMGATDEALACSWRCRARDRRLWWRREVCGDPSCRGDDECCGYDRTDDHVSASFHLDHCGRRHDDPAGHDNHCGDRGSDQASGAGLLRGVPRCAEQTPATCVPDNFTALKAVQRDRH